MICFTISDANAAYTRKLSNMKGIPAWCLYNKKKKKKNHTFVQTHVHVEPHRLVSVRWETSFETAIPCNTSKGHKNEKTKKKTLIPATILMKAQTRFTIDFICRTGMPRLGTVTQIKYRWNRHRNDEPNKHNRHSRQQIQLNRTQRDDTLRPCWRNHETP